MKRARILCLASLLLAACGDLQGFGGPAPPLASFNVVFHGDLASLRPPGVTEEHSLRVALVWGAQWLTEPFCVLPADPPEAAPVIEAGCRDTFGFVPAAVSVSIPITVDVPATLTLAQLPGADVMVGDVTARVAFGSLVVFDDRDDSGTLELSRPHRAPSGDGRGDFQTGGPDSLDIIYGASFVTMTAPDQRIAYREGGWDPASAFYPRAGCAPPEPGFRVLAASGFSAEAGLASALSGGLPQEEDLSICAVSPPADATISIDARAPADVGEVGCDERTDDSSVRYREPPTNAPDPSRTAACAHLPTFDTGPGSPASGLIQFVVSGRSFDRCKGLTHYTLRGCREDVNCPVPDWDFTANPPAWWTCGQ